MIGEGNDTPVSGDPELFWSIRFGVRVVRKPVIQDPGPCQIFNEKSIVTKDIIIRGA